MDPGIADQPPRLMSSVKTNLRILKPSRSRPHTGDVFVLRPRSLPYLFGRIIRIDARIGSIVGILACIYKVVSPRRVPVPPLRRDELLIPPLIINRLPWSQGYFETVERLVLTPWDVLPVHCFQDFFTKNYFDEYGLILSAAVPPVGSYGLNSFRTIDDDISDALGIPRVPD